jgi:sec-independent protein translocase protein TatA
MGTTEWIIAGIVIFVLFGATQLPRVFKALGRSAGEFKKGQAEVEKEIKEIENPKTA